MSSDGSQARHAPTAARGLASYLRPSDSLRRRTGANARREERAATSRELFARPPPQAAPMAYLRIRYSPTVATAAARSGAGNCAFHAVHAAYTLSKFSGVRTKERNVALGAQIDPRPEYTAGPRTAQRLK